MSDPFSLRVPEGYRLKVYDEIDSTNTQVMRLAQSGEAAGLIVLAHRQHNGRGRMGRSFYSRQDGLYFSLLLRNESPTALSLVTLRTAVAVYRAVLPFAKGDLSIKWVNDIYLNHQKLCGILAETRFDGDQNYTAVGIGINLLPVPQDISATFSHPAAALFSDPNPQAKADILYRFAEEFKNIEPDFLTFYKEKCNTLGKTVSLRQGDRIFSGEAVDILPDGSLLIKQNDGYLSFGSGEVTSQI